MPYQMSLALDLSFSHHQGRWRLPGSWVGYNFPDLRVYKELALAAERGCMDMIFFGDGTGIPSTYENSIDAAVRWGIGSPRQDMSPFIAALAQETSNIGFGLTYSSTFLPPFYVARLLNSLDHITKGRMAFNIVTSSRGADAANYGFDELMDHDARYRRMEEFVEVCTALWRSVGRDAYQWDRESGHVADPSLVAPINHDGEFFKVKGPLNTVPSPQQAPVLIQAGGSPRGIQASSRFADVIFGGAFKNQHRAEHRRALDAALVESGRDPEKVGILWDLQLIVGQSSADAKARKDQLQGLLPREAAAAQMSHNSGLDFSQLPSRFTLAELTQEVIAKNASPVTFRDLIAEYGEGYEMTPDELIDSAWRTATGYDHTIAGSAEEVADYLEESYEASGSRGGFMIAHPQVTPRDLIDVVGLLIPELQRRGRFRTSYEGTTLRDTLGVPAFA
ncbi:NtaA/DmoA family FMN-dependent monooxygenase [Salinibacterium sp. dk2585]|uniref:NtaA/DmoA family FMN-dependent monooxygenase n=1 Tax=unclassified Salinibacterium TaxID=2632331 RepID=UPI0011C24827|nr:MULTISPECIES: NtaA/DmoA family FMN-dependent monooxygenase [unclassified Salinibacterium]QEE60579.1 NtaA/DmoA family FMN-dependent monooxygenase [Salinibacterium sp. dk2585]TXK55651.1 NtaA/DmoA family FMN-dependent monooxygenase [Salinibacterium sp. dk5596]